MGTAAGMLAQARKSLGLKGRPNYITKDYASRHGSAFLRAAWCDMSITYWARKSGNEKAVLPGGDRAYTVWHAQDFQKIGRWKKGTAANLKKYARPGDIVFFDWGYSDSIGAIDHVGIIEKNLGDGRVQTIEGNTSDACLRRVRSASVIAGFGQPKYDSSSTSSKKSDSKKEDDTPMYSSLYDEKTRAILPGVSWVLFGQEAADKENHHDGPAALAILHGPARYTLNFCAVVSGLAPGESVRVARIEAKHDAKKEDPIVEEDGWQRFEADENGIALVNYNKVDSVSKGDRVRLAIEYKGSNKPVLGAREVKILYWKY